MTVEMIYYDWTPESMLEVTLPEPDNFLKVRETLTRIGVSSRKEKVLYQSCHILHKQGHYYIVHFKELFAHSYIKPKLNKVNKNYNFSTIDNNNNNTETNQDKREDSTHTSHTHSSLAKTIPNEVENFLKIQMNAVEFDNDRDNDTSVPLKGEKLTNTGIALSTALRKKFESSLNKQGHRNKFQNQEERC